MRVVFWNDHGNWAHYYSEVVSILHMTRGTFKIEYRELGRFGIKSIVVHADNVWMEY